MYVVGANTWWIIAGGGWCRVRSLLSCRGSVGAMKSGCFGGKLAHAFFVSLGKVGFEVREGPLIGRTLAPVAHGVLENFGRLDYRQKRADCSCVADRIAASCRNGLTLMDPFP